MPTPKIEDCACGAKVVHLPTVAGDTVVPVLYQTWVVVDEEDGSERPGQGSYRPSVGHRIHTCKYLRGEAGEPDEKAERGKEMLK